MMNGQNKYSVCVLMSSYNGEKYIEKQIQSVFKQKDVQVKLIIRDDGSNDNTVKIIERLSELYNIKLIKGKNVGAKASFFELIRNCPEKEYVAFCDQDDYWKDEKLYKALKNLEDKENLPAMYYSNLYVVDEQLEGNTKMFDNLVEKNFGKSLNYNNVVGCTLVVNASLMQIVKKSLSVKPLCFHDQWISLICSCVNGTKIADNEAYILYRQHENNEVGANEGIKKKIIKSSFWNGKKVRSNIAKQVLESLETIDNCYNLSEVMLVANYEKNMRNKIELIRAKNNNPGLLNFLTYLISIVFNLY